MENNDSQLNDDTTASQESSPAHLKGQMVSTGIRDPFDQASLGASHNKRRAFLYVLLAVLVVVACASIAAALMRKPQAPSPQPEPPAKEEVVVSDTPQPVEVTPEEPPAPQEPVHAQLMMIGDILLHKGVIESSWTDDGTLNYDHLFTHIADDVAQADVAVVNQETILGGSAWPYSGYPQFNGPQEVGDAEVNVGFDVILKATNHTFDMGYPGVESELDYWANEHPEMKVIGAAYPYGDGIAPAGGTSPAGAYLFEKDGLRVALLNYTDVLNGNVDPENDFNVLAIMDEERINTDVAAAREAGADLVVVFAHWGEEYETWPCDSERYWAGVFKDAGVDVVVGGHPHVIQPVEVLDGGEKPMLVCWSVGNFVSTQNDARNMVGGMVKLDMVKDANGARIERYEFIPTITQKEPWTTNMSAYKLSDYNDELAAQSVVSSWAGEGGTLGWYLDFCSNVLGDAFDWDTLSVHGSL